MFSLFRNTAHNCFLIKEWVYGDKPTSLEKWACSIRRTLSNRGANAPNLVEEQVASPLSFPCGTHQSPCATPRLSASLGRTSPLSTGPCWSSHMLVGARRKGSLMCSSKTVHLVEEKSSWLENATLLTIWGRPSLL